MKLISLIFLCLSWHACLLSFDDAEKCKILHEAISLLNFDEYSKQLRHGKTAFLRTMRGCQRLYGDSVIHSWARFNGDPTMLLYLRQKIRLSIFDRTTAKETPLMLASATGNLRAVKALLATYGVTTQYINEVDAFGRTALHRATMGNHAEVLAELIAYGGSVHLEDDFGVSVASLVQNPRFMKCRTAFYHNVPADALHTPVAIQSEDESDWNDNSSLLGSQEIPSSTVIRDRKEVLLERTNSQLALHRAVLLNDMAMIKNSISEETMKQVDSQGNTALHYFAEYGSDEKILKFLKKKGMNIFKKNNQGQTPLMLAVSVESFAAVKLLTDKKSVNLQDKSNRTALHYAVVTKNEHLIEWLLKNGADSWFVDSFNRTALEYAEELGFALIFQQLKEAIHDLTLSKEPRWERVGEEKPSRGCSLFGSSSSSKKKRERSTSEVLIRDYPFAYGGVCLF